MKYLSLQQILALHRKSLEKFGGTDGIRDRHLLKSVVMRPLQTVMGQDAYPDVFAKAAALMESLAKNHPFLDGNKRIAFISAVIFLEVNGYRLIAEQDEASRFVFQIAAGTKKETEVIAAWLKKHSSKI